MRGRVIGAAVLTAAVGVAGGAALASAADPAPSSAGVPVPVPAESPSVPTLPTPTPLVVNPDLDVAQLFTPTKFVRITVGNSLATWSIVKPKGWQAYCISKGQEQVPIPDKQVDACADSGVYFRPPGEGTTGGYSYRVQTLSDHQTPAAKRIAKTAAIQGSTSDAEVQVLPGGTDSSVYLSFLAKEYGTNGYLLRHNFFQWFAAPGDTEATLEMSVNGRERDDAGLHGLFDAFASRLEPVS